MSKEPSASGAADGAADEPALTWREQAVARSLDSARTRAENRVQRFLDAALELMDEGDGKDFTVQEVVERSGQSLRSFYQYFGGKHELLLALFEESVRTTADHLRERLADLDDPGERLHVFVVEYYRLCRPAPAPKSSARAASKPAKKVPTTPVIIDFAQQLLTGYPAEAAAAFAPLVTLFVEVLEGASTAGVVRADIYRGPIAGIVLEAIMFNAFSTTIGGAARRGGQGDPAEELWDLILHGIGVPEA